MSVGNFSACTSASARPELLSSAPRPRRQREIFRVSEMPQPPLVLDLKPPPHPADGPSSPPRHYTSPGLVASRLVNVLVNLPHAQELSNSGGTALRRVRDEYCDSLTADRQQGALDKSFPRGRK